MMINHAEIAWRQLQRIRHNIANPPLLDTCVIPPTAWRAGASDGSEPLSKGPSSDPRGSAVEAGRPVTQSDPGDDCDCPVCTSDCARVAPCQRKAN
jgi:hypothetical protein